MFISKALIYHNRDWINRLDTPVLQFFKQKKLWYHFFYVFSSLTWHKIQAQEQISYLLSKQK